MPRDLDLDVDDVEKLPQILRDAAEAYRESESELSSAWQDAQAGKVWGKVARILERAADQIDKVI